MSEMISISEAAAKGIALIRKPIWANPADHIKIDIIDGKPGPWLHLYSPANEEINGRNPVDFLWAAGPLAGDINERAFIPFEQPKD